MVGKYVVVVHNRKWGNHYKEFEKKKDAVKYQEECDVDMNTYAWLYKLVDTWSKEDKPLQDKPVKEVNPLEELENRLNEAHNEYLKYKPKTKEYKETKEVYLKLAEEYQKKFRQSLRK